jgi:hypothetical protein
MTVQVSRNGCTWWAYLLERKTGGFDLFYDHDNSYFKPLETPKITMLRHMTERGEHLVAHLDPERNQKKLSGECETVPAVLDSPAVVRKSTDSTAPRRYGYYSVRTQQFLLNGRFACSGRSVRKFRPVATPFRMPPSPLYTCTSKFTLNHVTLSWWPSCSVA